MKYIIIFQECVKTSQSTMKNKESGQEYSNNLEVIEMKLKEKLDKNISEESKNSSMKLVSKKGY